MQYSPTNNKINRRIGYNRHRVGIAHIEVTEASITPLRFGYIVIGDIYTYDLLSAEIDIFRGQDAVKAAVIENRRPRAESLESSFEQLLAV